MVSIWLRNWRHSPLLTAQFSITIAIGMGSAAALLSLMLALGYQPLPFRDPGQLVAVWERGEPGAQVMAVSGPNLTDLAAATQSAFASLGGFAVPPVWLVDRIGATEIRACGIEAGAFVGLGILPILGRGVHPDHEPLGSKAAAPVWISHQIWQARYGGSPSVIGTTIGIASSATGSDRVPLRIAGVFPPAVNIPLPFMQSATDLWYILPPDLATRPREAAVFFGLGRLRPEVSVAQAQAALTLAAERLEQRFAFRGGKRPVVQSLVAIAQGPPRQTLGLLVMGVGLVVLVGGANLVILMSAEGRKRRREIAIRRVLGAGRWRIWREVAGEKCLLTVLSLGLGVVFAFALLRLLAHLVPAAGLGPPIANLPPLDVVVLLAFASFALAASLVWSALLVAAAGGERAVPAIAAASAGPGYSGLTDSVPRSNRWRLFLLAVQAGTGTLLLAAAALAAATYAKLSEANLGPAPDHTVLMLVSPRSPANLTDAQSADFNQQVLSRLEGLPGTQAVALADWLNPWGFPIVFQKQGDGVDQWRQATSPFIVSPGYFRTLGIPILFGRSFDDTDHTGGEPVVIISIDMAEQNWASPELSLGSQIAFGPKFQTRYKVVGVAGNFTGYWYQKPVPTEYLSAAQSEYCCGAAILRTTTPPSTVAALAPQVLAGMAIPATISEFSTMQSRWQATLTRPQARMAGMFLLALLGLGLSAQGVYAVASATVAERRHELAVRSTLGAPPAGLAWSVTRELVLAVLVGAAFGVVGALDLRPVLELWLGPIIGWPAEPVLAAIALLTLAAAVGCYFPTRGRANEPSRSSSARMSEAPGTPLVSPFPERESGYPNLRSSPLEGWDLWPF